MAALARWCFRHRAAVVGLWVALLLALGGAQAAFGTSYSEVFSLPGTESTKALTLLQKSLPADSGDSDQIVVHVDSGSVRDPAVKPKVAGMLEKISTLPSVTSVTSMYSAEGSTQVSTDGRTAYATIQFDKQANELPPANVQKVIDTAQAARGTGLEVELGGQAITQVTQTPPGSSELIGIAAAAVILFLAFGSLLGMLLPLIVAVAGLGGGLLTIGLLSHAISLSSIAPTLAALIGLGVGIDYALFIVTRYRTGLQAGLEPEDAAIRALNTSGRAVLFAGGTVVIALLGLLVLGLNFLNGMGIGSAITVAFTILSALTLLPAMLGIFGVRLITREQRRTLATEGPRIEGASGAWANWATLVGRHKALLSIGVVIVIALLSIPTLSIRLGSSDSGNDKADTTTRKAYDLLADGFGPGFNGPLQLVAEQKTPADAQAFTSLLATVKTTEGVAAVQAIPAKAGAPIAIAIVVPTSAPQDQATNDLIERLRERVVPAAEQGTSLQVYVGGSTAIFKDFASVLTSKLPLFLGVIIALGCLLLMLAFRSIVVPLTAAVMNVLAAAASFGVIVAIFQWGWGAGLLNIGREGPIEAFVPVIMLAILFGLSMDYQVFLVSRMHEEWTHTHDNERSVRIGQAETGRVITAAALIMVCVFGAFVLGGERVIGEFGIGLAAAVAIDAFLLRTILVPALMHLFGPANWWLPGWLDRIMPHLSVEPADEPEWQPAPDVAPEDGAFAGRI
jgi:RND superfamily putative drug exporter